MDVFTVGWIVWILAFVGLEGVALASHSDGATLSEHVWDWFAVAKRGTVPDPLTRARRVFLLGFMAWLSVHFVTGGSFV